MIYEKRIRMPAERVGALIGKEGKTKGMIESACAVRLRVRDDGEVLVSASGDVDAVQPFKAAEIVTAVGRGFSPESAMRLVRGENALHVMDLREFGARTGAQLARIRARLIGREGKARRNIENLSNTAICVYGRTVSVIGSTASLRLAVDALSALSQGSMHGSVYSRMESARRRKRVGRVQLWEDQNVF